MTRILSCDWGSSFCRLRLADAESMDILAEEISGKGIADTFNKWKATRNNNDEKRMSFFIGILKEHIQKIEVAVGSLQGIPLIISGMASSSAGMLELPYRHVPFATGGSGANTHFIKANKDFDHDILLISGVQTDNDVMRGEETQLIGCITNEMNNDDEKMFIFPGTHSKHILVKNKQVVGFKTYMTGEFFELLSQKSILHNSVQQNQHLSGNLKSFRQGVQDAVGANLLHASFMVRTNELLQRFSKEENYHYLSGLLTGTEFQDIVHTNVEEIFLCCGSNLKAFYEEALNITGLISRVNILPPERVDKSVIRGQLKIFYHFKQKYEHHIQS